MPKARYNQTIYSIRPETVAAVNNLRITTEGGQILFHVSAQVFPLKGRAHTVLDDSETEYMTTRQDYAAIFPCHAVIRNNMPVATVGQQGIISSVLKSEISDFKSLITKTIAMIGLINV